VPAMRTWTSTATVDARPIEVLDVLTDPAAALRWSPFPFDLEDFDGDRLEAGDVARVAGSLAGVRVGFAVEVHAADEERLWLTARGPIDLDVEYALEEDAGGTAVTASVVVSGGGLRGRALAKATDALLAAGALAGALGRIAREAEAVAVA
jgi:Polyketide cyclase / dehydrase and lipid transport